MILLRSSGFLPFFVQAVPKVLGLPSLCCIEALPSFLPYDGSKIMYDIELARML
jgi:hypothetical protein